MLALRLVLTDAPPTMVFDEVDAGVGGEAAQAVGGALAEVAERHQVLVVTHLAQVAACAAQQLGVRKDVLDRAGPWPTPRCSRTTTGWSSWPACCRGAPARPRPAATPRSSWRRTEDPDQEDSPGPLTSTGRAPTLHR